MPDENYIRLVTSNNNILFKIDPANTSPPYPGGDLADHQAHELIYFLKSELEKK